MAHIYAYVLFLIYMTPVVMIVLFSFQNYPAIRAKSLDLLQWTLVNFFGHAGLRVPDQPGQAEDTRRLYLRPVRQRGHRGRHPAELCAVGYRGGAGLRDRGSGGELHLQEQGQEARHGAGIQPAVPVAAAHHSDLLFLPHLLQLGLRVVCAQQQPVLEGECAVPDRDGLHGGEAALCPAHDQGVLLCHRRGAGGRGAESGGQPSGHVPEGQAADRAAQRAGGLRAELQRPVHRVRHVRHLPVQLRQELRHGHPEHVRRGGPGRLQRERLRPSLRVDGVHHAGQPA